MYTDLNPLISILVPVYRVEKFIVECATSLFEQTYDNIEYIFVDDCSPDSSINLLNNLIDKYPLRKPFVHIIRHEENKGLSATRNTAVRFSHGEYVMHVDSDDYIDFQTVQKCVDTIHLYKADVVVFGYENVFSNKIQVVKNEVPTIAKVYAEKLIQRKCIVCLCGGLYKRSLYFDYNVWAVEGLEMGEDYVTKPRLVYNANKIVSINEALYNYRQTNVESCTNVFKEKHIRDLTLAISVLKDFFQSQVDWDDFKESIRIGALSTKAILLVDWALKGNNRNIQDSIASLYKEYISLAGLRMQDKIVLWLANHNFFRLLRLFVYIGYYVKYFFK